MILLSSANAASGSRLAPSQDDSTVIIACFHEARIPFQQGGPVCRERDAPHPTRRVAAWVNPLHPGPADDLLVRFPHARATTAVPIYNKRNLDRHERSDRDGCLLNRPGLMSALPRQEQHLNRPYPQHGRHTPPYRRTTALATAQRPSDPTDNRSNEVHRPAMLRGLGTRVSHHCVSEREIKGRKSCQS
jgi:hypothetical protein